MKKAETINGWSDHPLKKTFLIMRIIVFLLLATFFQTYANDAYSQRTKLSLNFNNTALEQVLDAIENQSEFFFLYNEKLVDVKRKVSVKANDQAITEILNGLFEGTDVEYSIVDRKIVLAPEDINEAVQQQRIITGKVTDSGGQPLPGVTIVVKGTTNGTITSPEGNYSLTNIPEDATLVFSFVGMRTQELVVGRQATLNAMLVEESIGLEEVVAIGYGTQKKINLTGAVSSLSSEELSTVPVPNVATLLYGQLPGLITLQRSGQPGNDGVSLNLRGFGGPLVVVDGITGRNFDRLDPNEIESITILKDAASAAVYGVSGGNGVILIETKKGKIGKPEFSYNMNYGVQNVTRYPRFVTSAEFAELKNEASLNIGGPKVYSDEEIEKFRNGTDPEYPNVNYYDVFIQDNAPQMQQNISVSGGSESINYFFLLGYTDQESMWKAWANAEPDPNNGTNQDFKKYNFRSNVNAKINTNFDVEVEFGGRREDRNNLIQDSYLMASWMQYQWPIYEPYTPDGKVAFTNYGLSAYLDDELAGYINDQRYYLEGAITLNYKVPFINGLKASVMAAQDIFFRNQKYWRKQYGLHMWDAQQQASYKVGAREANTLTLDNWRSGKLTLNASLNYQNSFNEKHNVSGLLLFEENEFTADNFGANRLNYVVPIDQIFAGPDLNKSNWGGASDDGRQSLVGRLNYDFLSKYLFEYSFRYDGSARFPADTRWGYFSGVSAGWRVSEESFFKSKVKNVDNLKLRASYGTLGNDQTGRFQFLTGFTYPSQNYILGGNSLTTGMVDRGIPNPNITWEKSRVINIGFDLSLYNNLIGMEIDVFDRYRKGLLATRILQLPSTFGASLPAENINSDNTKGFEVVLTHTNRINDFHYNVRTNFTFTKSKWIDYEEKEFASQYDRWRNGWEGRFKNRYMGLNQIGQFQSYDEIFSSPIQDSRNNTTLRPGDYKYEDFNGDGTIDGMDYQPLQRGSDPEITYGIALNASWKNFFMDMNWQGASNYFMLMEHYLIQPFANDMSTYSYFMDRWRRVDPTDPNSEWIPGKYPTTINDGASNNKQWSNAHMKDATYLRLKVLRLGYQVKGGIINDIGLKSLNISLSGQNLLTLTKLPYMDPETPNGRLSLYPQMKTYNLGVNVIF